MFQAKNIGCNQASFQALGVTTMKSLAFLLSVAASLASASAFVVDHDASDYIPAGASITLPRAETLSSLSLRGNGHSKPKKDNWGNAVEQDRKKITIRASKNDRDDISDDFLWAIKKANHGGLVHLQKGKKYVIGKKLDLSFLKDVYVKIDGELKVRPDFIMEQDSCSHLFSSPTISSTGKPTTFTIPSRRASLSGFGVESESHPLDSPT